jgi:hypothetical protein
MARAARAKTTAMRVVSDKEGNDQGGKDNGNGNKGVGQEMATVMKKAMATVTRVAGNKEGDGNKVGSDNSNKGGR